MMDNAHPSLCFDKDGLKRAASIRSSGGSTNFCNWTVYFTLPIAATKRKDSIKYSGNKGVQSANA
jgi:hypothetical protein